MDFGSYEDARPFGYPMLLHLGFAAFISHYLAGRKERTALHLMRRRRMLELQEVVDAIVASTGGLSIQDRVDILAGSVMSSATAALSISLAECLAHYIRPPRPVLLCRPPVVVCRPPVASKLAYSALTRCVLPLHRGHLESFRMDRGVRYAKALLIIGEHDLLVSRLASWEDDGLLCSRSLIRNVHASIRTRLRRLSLYFIPLGVLGDPAVVSDILSDLKRLCLSNAYCQIALVDPKGPPGLASHI